MRYKDEHDLGCMNHGGCFAEEDLLKDLRALRERIRPYDNGRGEGEYFAEEIDDLLRSWGVGR